MVEQQRMTFVQARIDEVRESFRGRQTSTRGRRRGRPRKRHNDDLDEWTPDRPRAVRGRKRGRPPSNSGRGRAVATAAPLPPPAAGSLSPVRKAPRGRGRVANDRQRPGPKPKLEGPGPPPAVFTPGGKCFVCSKAAGSTGSPLTALTTTTKIQLHQKLGRIVGAELDLIVDEDGVLCHGCSRLLNYIDRIEVEHNMLTKSILNCMRRTFGFGYVQGDNRTPEAVLASIEGCSKNSMIPMEKVGINAETADKVTATAGIQNKPVALLKNSNDDKKKAQATVNKVPESKTDTPHLMKNYQCKICTFKSKYKSVFLFHLRQHLQNSYRCDFCNVLLPKGYKLTERKNVEQMNSDVLIHKIESVEESVAVSDPKEVKDYVETMIEELHTTGIVTTMKPATPERHKSALETKLRIRNVNESEDTVVKSEVKDVEENYVQQTVPTVDQGTVNILLTFPNEKRQSISISRDVTVSEHQFSSDVARELQDIFGNFNDEPIDVDEQSMSQKENVENQNITFVKTLPEHTQLESSSLIEGSRSNVQNIDSRTDPANQIPNPVTFTDNLEDHQEAKSISCDDEDEDRYHRQLALLDEMGLIMLPKRNRTSVNNHSFENEEKVTVNAEQEGRWCNTGENVNSINDSQNSDSQPTKDVELEELKVQGEWLPGSLNHEEAVSVASSNVDDVSGSDARQQSEDGNGHEWFKGTVGLVDESTHWLHQTDSNPNTNSNNEISVWPNTENHCVQQEAVTASETEQSWLLSGSSVPDEVCGSEVTEDMVNKRNTSMWDQVQTSNTDSGDMFRRNDADDNVNNDTSVSISREVGVINAHTVTGTDVSDSNECYFEVGKSNITESSSVSPRHSVIGEQCIVNVSWQSDPNDKNFEEEPQLVSNDEEKTGVFPTKNDELEVVHINESAAQEPSNSMVETNPQELMEDSSAEATRTNDSPLIEECVSPNVSEVKLAVSQPSEIGVNSIESGEVDCKMEHSAYTVNEMDIHLPKDKEENEMDFSTSVESTTLESVGDRSEITYSENDVTVVVKRENASPVDRNDTVYSDSNDIMCSDNNVKIIVHRDSASLDHRSDSVFTVNNDVKITAERESDSDVDVDVDDSNIEPAFEIVNR